MTGSHCDAIPLAGRYDGTLGVLGGIAAIKGLQEAGFKPQKSIEVLFFTSEEPTRFGLGCIGRYVTYFACCQQWQICFDVYVELRTLCAIFQSHCTPTYRQQTHLDCALSVALHVCSRAMAGTMTPEFLEGKLDANGTTFQAAANAVGYGGKSHKVQPNKDAEAYVYGLKIWNWRGCIGHGNLLFVGLVNFLWPSQHILTMYVVGTLAVDRDSLPTQHSHSAYLSPCRAACIDPAHMTDSMIRVGCIGGPHMPLKFTSHKAAATGDT